VELLILTGDKTDLYPQIKRIVESLDKDIFDRIQKWRMFSSNWELEIKDYHGKKISYKGIKFAGSSELVYWHYFQPFFNHEIPKVLSQISYICKEKHLEPKKYVEEGAELLKVMCSRLWKEIAKTHQLLKADGFPKPEDLKDMSNIISSCQQNINDEVKAVLLNGKSSSQTSLDISDENQSVSKLNIWEKMSMFEKVGFIGSIASIIGIGLYFLPSSVASENIKINNNNQSPVVQNNYGNITYTIDNSITKNETKVENIINVKLENIPIKGSNKIEQKNINTQIFILNEAKQINKKKISINDKNTLCKQKASATNKLLSYDMNIMIEQCNELF
jgi:hypothetical protein